MSTSVRARLVALLSGAALACLGLTAPAHAAGGIVSGTVYIGSTATPGDNLTVTATYASSTVSGVTDTHGGWSLTLDPGTWQVCFSEPAVSFSPSARFIDDGATCVQTLVDPGAANTSYTTTLPRAGTVSGSLSPVPSTSTAAFLESQQADGTWRTSADPFENVGADGSFTVKQVPDGTGYRLCFESIGQPIGCAGGLWPENATPISVHGDHVTIPATGLAGTTTLHGIVTAPRSTTPVAGATVALLRQVPSGVWEDVYDADATSSSGGWSLAVVPGRYRIRITPPDTLSGAAVTTSSLDVSGADQPSDTALAAGGSITGRLTLPGGEDVKVVALDPSGAVVGSTRTSGGSFAFGQLSSGTTYSLVIAGNEDAVSSLRTVISGVVAPATVYRTIGAGGTLTGTVLDADVPVGGAPLRAWAPDGSAPARVGYSAPDGSFTIGGLDPGVRYDLSVDPVDWRALRYAKTVADTTDITADATSATSFLPGASVGVIDLSGIEGHVAPAVAPTISGTPQVGNTLTAITGSYSPAPTQVLYTWYADSTQVTQPSVSPTYVVTPAVVNRQISVQVTAQATGYKSARLQPTCGVAFAPTPVVPATLTVTRGPAITGTAKVGKRLAVHSGTASPAASASIQWLRNGVVIPRATGASYKVAKADKGKRISVRVTYTRGGYPTVVRTSAATGKVGR